MLRWAFICLVIAVVAGLFGFSAVAAGFAGIAKVLFGVFLALFILLSLTRLMLGDTK